MKLVPLKEIDSDSYKLTAQLLDNIKQQAPIIYDGRCVKITIVDRIEGRDTILIEYLQDTFV